MAKWKIVVIELETGYSWELSSRMKRKRAVKAAKRLALRRDDYSAYAIPEELHVKLARKLEPEHDESLANDYTGIGQDMGERFATKLRHIADTADFSTLGRIGLLYRWVVDEYQEIKRELGCNTEQDESDPALELEYLRNGDTFESTAEAYEQLGLPVPNSLLAKAS